MAQERAQVLVFDLTDSDVVIQLMPTPFTSLVYATGCGMVAKWAARACAFSLSLSLSPLPVLPHSTGCLKVGGWRSIHWAIHFQSSTSLVLIFFPRPSKMSKDYRIDAHHTPRTRIALIIYSTEYQETCLLLERLVPRCCDDGAFKLVSLLVVSHSLLVPLLPFV